MTSPTSRHQPSPGGGMLFLCGLTIIAVAVGLVFMAKTERASLPDDEKLRTAVPDSVKPVHPTNAPGLHNVYRLGDTLYSGSSPDEDGGFESLERLGIKTIVSVDGAPPDVEGARARGLRYVHLPMTYGSVPHEVLVELVRVTRELPGPVYLHCHHGKHRGPAAVVALWRCLDSRVTTEQAFATMKLIGTADRYQGLYDSVRDLNCPTNAELAASKSDLPESTPVPPLAKSMAEIDRMWERVAKPSSTRNATSLSLQLDTAYDLAEQFREAARLGDVAEEMQPGFQLIVVDLEALAEIIKQEFRSPDVASPQRAKAVARVESRCAQCHADFRN